MLRLPNRASTGVANSKRKLLLWLALVSLFVGIGEIGAPLDLTLRTLRDKVRAQPVSGEVVVVGIDEDALSSNGPWPWNRRKLALATERLFAAGAERVFFDLYLQPHEPAGDAELVRTLNRYPGRVFVASVIDYSADAEVGRPILPMPGIAEAAETVSVMKVIRYWNGISSVPYRAEIGGTVRRSMEAAISGVDGKVGVEFPVDYSYRISSVPYLSIADVLADPRGADVVRGKTVVIGTASVGIGDIYSVPGQGRASGVFIVALGAETLANGRPLVLGWFPLWLLAFGASFLLLCGRRRGLARVAGVGALGTALALPLMLENNNVFVDAAPALILLASTMISAAWQWFGAKKRSQGSTNQVSGLQTVNSISHEIKDSNILIAVRVRRFANIVSTLRPEHERELVGQIVSRLAMAAGDARMLHGDDGNFIWIHPVEESAALVDRFKALQLIFRNPVKVADKSFDVDVTFGVDQEMQMPLSHRLASALAAAHAASDEGIHWKVHDPAATGATEWALSLLGELDHAIDAGDVWIAYQPKMDLATGAIIGAEALVRWTHATRGPINPAEFVEATERHGRIDRLTAFVLDHAVRAAAGVAKYDADFTVSVNISPCLLISREIVDMVRNALRRYRLPASRLVLEITETAAMAREEAALALLDDLRAMGVALSIDDYGTGLSTLEYLRRIPATELKIDRRFAASLQGGPEDRAVMRSTIELAHILGMKVVAEGIETAETLEILAAMGCDIGQGYHIGRPMEWSSLAELLAPPRKRTADG